MNKKILVLTSRWPYPVVGGDRLRVYAICRELSKQYSLTLLSLCESRAEMEMAVPDDGVFNSVERVFLPRWRSWLNCLMALPGARPLQVAYYECDAFRKEVEALLDCHDLAFAHLIRTAHYLRNSTAHKVLDMTDAISLNYARVFGVAKASGIKNVIYGIEKNRLRDYERAIVNRFDFSLLCSPVDRDFLFPPGSQARDKVRVCANGVDFESIRFAYSPDAQGKTIVFIGNMTSVQNLDAARWFCQRVMPLLLKDRAAGWRFKIIGRMKRKEQSRFNRYAGVVATGYVENVYEEARGAFIGVCPVRIGAGIQNKILDYMALGLPCVASRIGGEGLQARAGEEILFADTAQDYAVAISNLSRNPDDALRLSVNGRKYVETHHAWDANLAPLLEGLEGLG